MGKTTFKLQNIILQHDDRFNDNWEMFNKENHMIYDEKKGRYILSQYNVFDYTTYFNSITVVKWKKYTGIDNLKLNLKIKGDFILRLMGITHQPLAIKKDVITSQRFSTDGIETISIDVPSIDFDLVGFEIDTLEVCELYSGFYSSEVDDEMINDVCLSLATTTFKKESFIIPNIEKLKTDIIESDDLIADNFYVHVIDNGRTLDADSLKSHHIEVHPNKNVGGSGGFSRGMIESFKQDRKPTHVLLMDDDVIILPESIKRTYNLLSLLKDEYKDHFISGAMLYYENKNIQHEDVGYVDTETGAYGPTKERQDFRFLLDVTRNEVAPYFGGHDHFYAGWWYCCIPATVIEKQKLPLPLFIRGDDVEYSLRNSAKFITLNGICVWHMGFTLKFNAAMELYQVHRNSLILQATSDVCKNVDFIERMKKFIRVEMLRFNYSSAELLLDAIDDYLKGPDFIAEDKGETIMKEKGAKNEQLVSLDEFPNISVDISKVYVNPRRGILQKLIYGITYNGHYLPKRLLKDDTGIIAYDWFYSPSKQFLKKRVIAVNPYMLTGAIRELDKKRFKEIKKRRRKVLSNYKKNHQAVEKAYREKQAEFTSYDFWKKYLEI